MGLSGRQQSLPVNIFQPLSQAVEEIIIHGAAAGGLTEAMPEITVQKEPLQGA
jgi:hypothetical protein